MISHDEQQRGARIRKAADDIAKADDIAVTIHHAMFKIAQEYYCDDITGVQMARLLDIEKAYGSEWNKIRNLVKALRRDGTIN